MSDILGSSISQISTQNSINLKKYFSHKSGSNITLSVSTLYQQNVINKKIDVTEIDISNIQSFLCMCDNIIFLKTSIIYFDYNFHSSSIFLSTIYYPRGSIEECVLTNTLDDKFKKQMIIDVCNMHYYYQQIISINQNIKPSNIMIKDDNSYEFMDFGLSLLQIIKDYKYTSSEVLQSKEVSKMSDIWSIGCVIYFIITNNHLVPQLSQEETLNYQLDEKYIDDIRKIDEYSDLLTKVMKINPNERITCSEIITILNTSKTNNNNEIIPSNCNEKKEMIYTLLIENKYPSHQLSFMLNFIRDISKDRFTKILTHWMICQYRYPLFYLANLILYDSSYYYYLSISTDYLNISPYSIYNFLSCFDTSGYSLYPRKISLSCNKYIHVLFNNNDIFDFVFKNFNQFVNVQMIDLSCGEEQLLNKICKYLINDYTNTESLRAIRCSGILLQEETLNDLLKFVTPLNKLECVDFSSCSLGLLSVQPLIKALENKTNLKELNLRSNRYYLNGIKSLFKSLSFCSLLHTLSLSACAIINFEQELCDSFCYFSNLRSLDLSGNRLEENGVNIISDNLSKLPCLYRLNLSLVTVQSTTIEYLYNHYSKSSLFPYYKWIDPPVVKNSPNLEMPKVDNIITVGYNQNKKNNLYKEKWLVKFNNNKQLIGETFNIEEFKHFTTLFYSLPNLSSFVLKNDKLNDICLNYLSKGLICCSSLKKIDLSYNEFSNREIDLFAKSLKYYPLLNSINIKRNDITLVGVSSLLNCVKCLTNITELSLYSRKKIICNNHLINILNQYDNKFEIMNRIEALHHEDKSLSEIELEDEKDIQNLYEDYKLLKCDYYFYALVNDIIRKGKCDYKKLENQQNLLIQSIISPFTISLKYISNECTAEFILSFLKATPYIVQIHNLDLSYSLICDCNITNLFSQTDYYSKLKSLQLQNNNITDRCLSSLVNVVNASYTLEELNLCCNRITEDGVSSFLDLLDISKEMNIYFSGNPIKFDMTIIERIYLSENSIYLSLNSQIGLVEINKEILSRIRNDLNLVKILLNSYERSKLSQALSILISFCLEYPDVISTLTEKYNEKILSLLYPFSFDENEQYKLYITIDSRNPIDFFIQKIINILYPVSNIHIIEFDCIDIDDDNIDKFDELFKHLVNLKTINLNNTSVTFSKIVEMADKYDFNIKQ